MIYTDKTKKAMKIMFECHKNQTDKGSIPYVFHSWHVAEQMKDETRTIVALLHDVVEDSNKTLNDLQKEGFDANIINTLKLLTHNKKEDYFEYIKNISTNPIATDVKLADLKHNSDMTRLTNINQTDLERLDRYKKCIDFLEKAKNSRKD